MRDLIRSLVQLIPASSRQCLFCRHSGRRSAGAHCLLGLCGCLGRVHRAGSGSTGQSQGRDSPACPPAEPGNEPGRTQPLRDKAPRPETWLSLHRDGCWQSPGTQPGVNQAVCVSLNKNPSQCGEHLLLYSACGGALGTRTGWVENTGKVRRLDGAGRM